MNNDKISIAISCWTAPSTKIAHSCSVHPVEAVPMNGMIDWCMGVSCLQESALHSKSMHVTLLGKPGNAHWRFGGNLRHGYLCVNCMIMLRHMGFVLSSSLYMVHHKIKLWGVVCARELMFGSVSCNLLSLLVMIPLHTFLAILPFARSGNAGIH